MKIIFICLLTLFSVAQASLENNLKGIWILKSLECNGINQPLEKMDYSLSFNGTKGEYISKTKECQQNEPEIYTYPSAKTVGIKSGVRTCSPNPCAADLAATECGKETNPAIPIFNVTFKDHSKIMILSTSDPKSVDCIGPNQKKPAVFKFSR